MMVFRSLSYMTQKEQAGWIMVEVVLCLALLSVVLYLAQRQTESQWQSIQVAEQQRQYRENRLKQERMKKLTGSDIWLDGNSLASKMAYPDCQSCSGNNLVKWFGAAQEAVVNVMDK